MKNDRGFAPIPRYTSQSSGESGMSRYSNFPGTLGITWYALMASSRKTKRAKHPVRHSLLARFQVLGITISSTCPKGSRSVLTACPSTSIRQVYGGKRVSGGYSLIDPSFLFGDIQGPVDSCPFHTNHTAVKTSFLTIGEGKRSFLCGGILDKGEGTIGPIFENFDVEKSSPLSPPQVSGDPTRDGRG